MYTKEEVINTYNKSEVKNGLKKYLGIMERLRTTDVSRDREFQKGYNHFYRMRQRQPEFYQIYFTYMEKKKDKASAISFEEVFFFIQKETGRCEASFSSKLLATLNSNKPVWDKFVLQNLGIKSINASVSEREQKIIMAYEEICQWYELFLKSDDAKLIISIFNQMFLDTEISNTKKVDLFLWQYRDK